MRVGAAHLCPPPPFDATCLSRIAVVQEFITIHSWKPTDSFLFKIVLLCSSLSIIEDSFGCSPINSITQAVEISVGAGVVLIVVVTSIASAVVYTRSVLFSNT